MNRLIGILALIAQATQSAELPILSDESNILHIPMAEYRSGDSIVYFRADLLGSSDFGTFAVVLAEMIEPPASDGDIDLSGIDGIYDGSLSAFEPDSTTKIGPFESCPPVPFNPGSATVTISSISSSVDLTISVFPDLTCILSGSIEGPTANGTFECSNFNEGSWSSKLLKPIANTDILVAEFAFVGDDCSFDSNFTGLRD